MKQEWRKTDKEYYGEKKEPIIVTVPRQQFIMIKGEGNPNDEIFSNKVSALYSLAYAIKMQYKASMKAVSSKESVNDFTVYPLEGIWTLKDDSTFRKENLMYTIMIAQPFFIDDKMVQIAMDIVKKKKPNSFYEDIVFQTLQDGLSIQILHTGSYDSETASFSKMSTYLEEHGYERSVQYHREIYLNTIGRVSIDKLKTILRYPIHKKM